MSSSKFFAVRNAIAKRQAPALPTVVPIGAFQVRIEARKGTTVRVRKDATIVVADARIVATVFGVKSADGKDVDIVLDDALVEGAEITIASDMFGGGRTTIDLNEFPFDARLVASDSGYDAVSFSDPRYEGLALAA
jgi:hypothetical protein